jgi:hypothetical protein
MPGRRTRSLPDRSGRRGRGDERCGVGRPRRGDHRLRQGLTRPAGARHRRPATHASRGRIPGRPDQRRAGAEGRRRRGSVDTAVDVAKESADIILLDKSRAVLAHGAVEGRLVFGNITKYVKLGASSKFGNMFSVLGARGSCPSCRSRCLPTPCSTTSPRLPSRPTGSTTSNSLSRSAGRSTTFSAARCSLGRSARSSTMRPSLQ